MCHGKYRSALEVDVRRPVENLVNVELVCYVEDSVKVPVR